MFLIVMILLTVFIIEVSIGFVPFFRIFPIKTIRGRIKYSNGTKDKLKITVKEKDLDKPYKLTHGSDSYIQLDKRRIYIFNPYKERLHAKTYVLDNGDRVTFKRRKPRLLFTFITLAVIIAVFASGILYMKKELVPSFSTSVIPVKLTHHYGDETDHDAYDGIFNLMLVGSDARGDLNPRADVIMIFSFNEKKRTLRYCSVSRDLYVEMRDISIMTTNDFNKDSPGYEYLIKHAAKTQWYRDKLNSAVNLQYINDGEVHSPEEHYVMGLNSLVDTVEHNFKMPIHGVINLSWSDFMKVIDYIGGVDAEITEQMLKTEYTDKIVYGIIPVLENQNELFGLNDKFGEAGVQHLNGNQALAYVRLRYMVESEDNSDVGRSARIRSLFKSIFLQKGPDIIKSANTELIPEIAGGIYCSLSPEELNRLSDFVMTLPYPVNAGLLPYDYHTYIDSETGVDYIAVDGKYEDRLEVQARKVICGYNEEKEKAAYLTAKE